MILYILIAAGALIPAALAGFGNSIGHSGAADIPAHGAAVRRTRGAALSDAAMFWLFVLLLLPAVLRYNVGNDYMRYVAFMHLANVHAYVPTEWGFNSLVRLIYGICGYENYLLVFAVFAAATIALFLLAIRLMSENFFFSFFLFICLGFYFRMYNTVRYYFALSVVLVALHLLLKGYRGAFVLLVLAAASFHKSALVVLALYPLCLIRWKWQGVLAGSAAVAAASVFRDFWLRVVIRLYPSYRGTSFEAGGTRSMANIVCCAAVLCLAAIAVYFERRTGSPQDRAAVSPQGQAGSQDSRTDGGRVRVYTQMNILALILHLFCWFIPEISRIGYYLTVTQIFLVPMLLTRLPGSAEGSLLKRAFTPRGFLTVLAAAAALSYFAMFLAGADDPAIRLLPYRTFLFHEALPAIIE